MSGQLIEELRTNAGAHPLDVRLQVMADAADDLESQAREIERLRSHVTTDNSATLVNALAEIDQLRAKLPSQGGEAVEVVGYGFKHVDKGWLFSSKSYHEVNPCLEGFGLMTVAQHRHILLSTVIRCEQKGAFKTCLECGYQDGHDLICQYHESKRAVVSDDLTNVRCQCCQSEHAHNSYDAGFIAGSGMCQACDAALPAKDIVSAASPADPGAMAVPIGILRVACGGGNEAWQALEELRALLANSEGLKP